MRRTLATRACVVACAWPLFGMTVVMAQEGAQPAARQSAESPPPESVDPPAAGTLARQAGRYESGERQIGTPVDVEADLNTSFPARDYVLPRMIPKRYFQWKEDLYRDYGLKLGISYQAIYLGASETQQAATNPFRIDGESQVASGWALVEGKWEVLNRGKDFQGSLVASLDWRHGFTGARDPVAWGVFDLGSQWPVEGSFISWDPWVPVGFWEQWFTKDRFVLRVGNQLVNQIFDFSRFKDPRVAFSGTAFTAPIAAMPIPGPGFATAFEWWPIGGSPLYVVGTLNDLNFEIGRWTWDKAITKGDFFYGLEIGYNWARGKGDFDHLHLNLFYADSPAVNPIPALPNEAGGGSRSRARSRSDALWGSAATRTTTRGAVRSARCSAGIR